MSELLPAYLIVGEDELKRDRVLERLRTRVEKSGDLDFNFDVFEPSAEGADVVSACNTMPFASAVRLVLVRGVDGMKKQSVTDICDYLKSPSETTVLALVAAKMAKNTLLYKSVAKLGKSAVIDCAPIKSRELPSLVRDMAVTHGFTLSAASAARIVELVGDNTVRLDGELRKLALAHQGRSAVGVAEVEALVTQSSKVKYWDFVDAFAGRRLADCLGMYERLDDSALLMLGRCVSRLRELIAYRSLAARRLPMPDAMAERFGMPAWKLKNHGAWARVWTDAELSQALASARDAERSMKSGAEAAEAFLDWLKAVLPRAS